MPAGIGFVGLSADTFLGVNKETTYGTLVGPTGGTESFLFLSESLKADRPLVPVPNISAAFLDVNQQVQGAQVVSGDIELACTYEGMENILLHCFGAVNNTAGAGSGSFTRDFDLTTKGRWRSTTSPSLSIHVARGIVGSGATNITLFSFAGCVVDSFQFTGARDQPLKIRVSFFGRSETLQVMTGSPSFPTAPVMSFLECQAIWGGTRIPLADFTVNVSRNLDKDRIYAGDLFTNEPPMGQYEVTCQTTTEWDNEKRVGTATLRDDYVNRTPRQLILRFISTATIVGTSIKYQWDIQLPAAIISQFAPNVSQRGRIMVTIGFKAFDNDTTNFPHEIRLTQRNARSFLDN